MPHPNQLKTKCRTKVYYYHTKIVIVLFFNYPYTSESTKLRFGVSY